MDKKFPRKEIYVCTFEKPISSEKVLSNNLGELKLNEDFKKYAEEKWSKENKGWFSSAMASVIKVFVSDKMKISYKMTEYKYFLGNIKRAIEKETSEGSELIDGLATEIMPITLDGYFPLERRSGSATQHAIGYYDIPTAGQNARVWFEKSQEVKPGLVKDICDMNGFPKWNLIRHLNLQENEIGEVFYNGFSKGFEVALAVQFNGLVKVNVFLKDLIVREKNKERFWYSIKDIPEILNSIGNDGIHEKIKKDIFGRVPEVTEDGFKLVEDTLGTILSNLWHIKRKEKYNEAKKILESKGYKIIEIVPKENIFLKKLV